MKKFLSAALLFLTFISQRNINAQNYWFQTAKPNMGAIASVYVDTTGYVFTGSNGGEISGSSDQGNTWVKLNNGLHGTNLMRSILTGPKGNIFAAGTGGVWISSNHGTNWTSANQGITDAFVYSLLYVKEIDTAKINDTTFVIDTVHVLYAGTYSKGIFRSTDLGNSWSLLSGFTAATAHANDLEVNPVNGNIFAGTYFQGMFRSNDRGTTWTKINKGMENQYVEELTIDSSGNIFAGTHSGVYRSRDNGENWTKVGLDSLIVLSMANFRGSILAGTEKKGVFLSTDGGNSWTNTGIPNDAVHSLAYGRNGIAFAGTNSGSIYRTTEAVTSVKRDKDNIPDKFSLKQNYPNPFNPSTNIRFDLTQAAPVSLKVYDLLGREVAVLVNETLSSGSYSFSFDASNLKSGIYLYKIQAGNYSDVKKMIVLK